MRAVAGGSLAAQSADRRHRQHPPRRILRRQTLFAGWRHRTSWLTGVARLRDAAPRAHEPDSAVVAAGAGGAVLARAVCTAEAGALGHGTARSLFTAALYRAGFR